MTEFRGLELIVEPGVFVPRDSSEWLAEQAARRLRKRKHPVLVDLASGDGHDRPRGANEVPKAEVFGAELSTEGVKLARRERQATSSCSATLRRRRSLRRLSRSACEARWT